MPTWGTLPELAEVVALAGAGAIHSEAEVYGLDDAVSAYGKLRQRRCARARGRRAVGRAVTTSVVVGVAFVARTCESLVAALRGAIELTSLHVIVSGHMADVGRTAEGELREMGLVDGKVALVTGAGRGQGRSHALRLAAEGADVIAVDIAANSVETISYALASEDDLDATVKEVEAMGRRAVKAVADVRSLSELQQAADAGLSELGKIDIVCANAGIGSWAVAWEMTEQQWKDMIDINLTGVFNTVRATLPSMVERGEGGSVVLTSSTAGLRAYANTAHYTAAKHGVIGLMKVLAQEAGPHRIRVNAVCPTTVRTPLVINDSTFELFAPHLENPTEDDVREPFESLNILPGVAWIEPSDVSDAVLFLCSDAAKFITGVALPIDAGNIVK